MTITIVLDVVLPIRNIMKQTLDIITLNKYILDKRNSEKKIEK